MKPFCALSSGWVRSPALPLTLCRQLCPSNHLHRRTPHQGTHSGLAAVWGWRHGASDDARAAARRCSFQHVFPMGPIFHCTKPTSCRSVAICGSFVLAHEDWLSLKAPLISTADRYGCMQLTLSEFPQSLKTQDTSFQDISFQPHQEFLKHPGHGSKRLRSVASHEHLFWVFLNGTRVLTFAVAIPHGE